MPTRSRITSGPENAFCTVTCWSSAKPISSAIGSLHEQLVRLVGVGEVQAVGHRRASSGVVGSPVAPRLRRATPVATAAFATASATDSATRRLNTLGMM